ncbi:MAG: hypothetical protein MZV70_60265 [Desulfobacterales bacterium]|nr:hypothetical protein [Desulfobacterales bacterium]
MQSYGAKGIGLFRTEFLYLDSKMSISEEEQCLIYKKIAQNIFPHPLVIRTYDLGRDKSDPTRPRREDNPSLGLMAVRLFLKEREPFKVQIKRHHARQRQRQHPHPLPHGHRDRGGARHPRDHGRGQEGAAARRHLPRKDVKVGIMLEIPAAVRLIRHLGDAVDFFSVGSNDLIQYLLAVDRNNTRRRPPVQPLSPGLHPYPARDPRPRRTASARK